MCGATTNRTSTDCNVPVARHANQSHLETKGLAKASKINLDAAAKGATARTLRFSNGEALAQSAGRRADDCGDAQRARSGWNGQGVVGGDRGEGGWADEWLPRRFGLTGRTIEQALVEQLPVLRSDDGLVRGLYERKVRVARHHGLWERGELHVLLAQLVDPPHNLLDRSLAAIEDRTQLDRGGFDDSHRNLLVWSGRA